MDLTGLSVLLPSFSSQFQQNSALKQNLSRTMKTQPFCILIQASLISSFAYDNDPRNSDSMDQVTTKSGGTRRLQTFVANTDQTRDRNDKINSSVSNDNNASPSVSMDQATTKSGGTRHLQTSVTNTSPTGDSNDKTNESSDVNDLDSNDSNDSGGQLSSNMTQQVDYEVDSSSYAFTKVSWWPWPACSSLSFNNARFGCLLYRAFQILDFSFTSIVSNCR